MFMLALLRFTLSYQPKLLLLSRFNIGIKGYFYFLFLSCSWWVTGWGNLLIEQPSWPNDIHIDKVSLENTDAGWKNLFFRVVVLNFWTPTVTNYWILTNYWISDAAYLGYFVSRFSFQIRTIFSLFQCCFIKSVKFPVFFDAGGGRRGELT